MQPENYKYSYKSAQRSLTALSVYNVGLQRCDASHRWGPGVRDHYLLHYVVSGRGSYTAQGKTYSLGAGDMFLSYPNTAISYSAESADPWEYYWVGFHGGDARALLEHAGFSPDRLVMRYTCGEELQRLLLSIYQTRGSTPGELVRMTGRLYEFLALLMQNAPVHRQQGSDIALEYVHRACDYVANNFANPISVCDIAQSVNLSRSRLYRLFMEHLSLSPIQYLTQFRIRQACVLLKKGGLPIQSVAYSVGFDDPLYFSKVFKKEIGCSPRMYATEC